MSTTVEKMYQASFILVTPFVNMKLICGTSIGPALMAFRKRGDILWHCRLMDKFCMFDMYSSFSWLVQVSHFAIATTEHWVNRQLVMSLCLMLTVRLAKKGENIRPSPCSDLTCFIYFVACKGSVWVRRGRVIEGPVGSRFGSKLAMSKGLNHTVPNFLVADPVRLAVSGCSKNYGFVSIYECLSEGCSQIGDNIVLDGMLNGSCPVHGMSRNGSIVAFGGYNASSNSSIIRFYQYDENMLTWEPQGITHLEFEGSVYLLQLSGAFDTLVLRSLSVWEGHGHDENHPEFEATDNVAVYHYNFVTREWEQFGQSIYHHVDGSGSSSDPEEIQLLGTRHRLSDYLHNSDPLALSDDGLVLAVGFPFSTDNAGIHVFAFNEEQQEWYGRGHPVSDNATHGFFGWSVALSGKGDVLVVGRGGDATATSTFLWTGSDWFKYGQNLHGGGMSSVAISDDGSVLAIGDDNVEIYHRNIQAKCDSGMELLQLSLTLDDHPEDTQWDIVSNTSGEVFMSGGPYEVYKNEFPYKSAYEQATLVYETCAPRNDCKIFSIYDKLDPLVGIFKIPDGSKFSIGISTLCPGIVFLPFIT